MWNVNFLGLGARAVVPYAHDLDRFAAHVQQLEMESNGKSVTVGGAPLDYTTGEIIFGEPRAARNPASGFRVPPESLRNSRSAAESHPFPAVSEGTVRFEGSFVVPRRPEREPTQNSFRNARVRGIS